MTSPSKQEAETAESGRTSAPGPGTTTASATTTSDASSRATPLQTTAASASSASATDLASNAAALSILREQAVSLELRLKVRERVSDVSVCLSRCLLAARIVIGALLVAVRSPRLTLSRSVRPIVSRRVHRKLRTSLRTATMNCKASRLRRKGCWTAS